MFEHIIIPVNWFIINDINVKVIILLENIELKLVSTNCFIYNINFLKLEKINFSYCLNLKYVYNICHLKKNVSLKYLIFSFNIALIFVMHIFLKKFSSYKFILHFLSCSIFTSRFNDKFFFMFISQRWQWTGRNQSHGTVGDFSGSGYATTCQRRCHIDGRFSIPVEFSEFPKQSSSRYKSADKHT